MRYDRLSESRDTYGQNWESKLKLLDRKRLAVFRDLGVEI